MIVGVYIENFIGKNSKTASPRKTSKIANFKFFTFQLNSYWRFDIRH